MGWLAESNMADIQNAAIELMGFSGWEEFVMRLERGLHSRLSFERISSTKALTKIGHKTALDVLRKYGSDPDPELQRELEKALHKEARQENLIKSCSRSLQDLSTYHRWLISFLNIN